MKNIIFQSQRYFTTFDMSSSHSRLLLRSQKNKDYPFNIDIVIFDTVYIQLFTMLGGISISMIDKNSFTKNKPLVENLKYPHYNLYEIESCDEKYYISAAFIRVLENELDFGESSIDFRNSEKSREIARG